MNLARNLFREQNDLERLVNKITTESQGLMQCTRCCVYIVDRPISSSDKSEVYLLSSYNKYNEDLFS